MVFRRCFRLLYALLLLTAWAGSAFAQCEVRPRPVRNYLRQHPGYALVTAGALGRFDRGLWRQAHRTLCPGMAIVDLAGRGEKSFALALTGPSHMERLILLQPQPKTLVPAFQVGDPLVVWRSRAKKVQEFGSRRIIAIPHDAIRFEKMGASSKIFYLAGGKIRSVLVVD